MKCICGYEQDSDFDEFIGGLYACPKCGTFKAKTANDEVNKPDTTVKEMNAFSIDQDLENDGCILTLSYETYNQVTKPSSFVKLTPDGMRRMIDILTDLLPKEEKPHVKELNTWSISGNVYRPENGIRLSLFNEDEKGNTTDDVVIKLNPKEAESLCKSLQHYLPKEESKPDPMHRCNLIITASMLAARMINDGRIDILKIEGGSERLYEFINNIVDKYLSEFTEKLIFDKYIEQALFANFGIKTKSACPCDNCKLTSVPQGYTNCKVYCSTYIYWKNNQ